MELAHDDSSAETLVEIGDPAALARRHFADPTTGWSVGGYGGIAEFHRDAHEPNSGGPGTFEFVTARGGIAFSLPAGTRAFAIEKRGQCAPGTVREVQFGLSGEAARMGMRDAIAEIGPDRDALRAEDRGGVLFDLGLGFPHVDAFVRVAAPEKIAVLRTNVGRSILEDDGALLASMRTLAPHRVFVSRLARVEVYGPIPAPGERSPDGPHTHVLRGFLRRPKADPAAAHLPVGWCACLSMHPATSSQPHNQGEHT